MSEPLSYGYVDGNFFTSIIESGMIDIVGSEGLNISFEPVPDVSAISSPSGILKKNSVRCVVTEAGWFTPDFDPETGQPNPDASRGVTLITGPYRVFINGIHYPTLRFNLTDEFNEDYPFDLASSFPDYQSPLDTNILLDVPSNSSEEDDEYKSLQDGEKFHVEETKTTWEIFSNIYGEENAAISYEKISYTKEEAIKDYQINEIY